MKDVMWIKLSVDTPIDEKIRALRGFDKEYSWIWICLLTLAGKTNDGGYIYLSKGVPYDSKQLADYCGTVAAKVDKALDLFTRLEMIEVDKTGIYIINWFGHQNGDAMEKAREQTKERMKKYRAKKAVTSA